MNLSSSSITYRQLQSLVTIREEVDDSKFDGWIAPDPKLAASTREFLDHLSARHRKNIDGYSEEEVKAKLVIPILNRVDFTVGEFTDWYERPLSASFGETIVSGTVDYLIAKGEKEPERPVFFIHEFKPTFTNRSPEVQLVTEMVVADHQSDSPAFNNTTSNPPPLRGAYLTGPLWRFVNLESHSGSYVYQVSPTLDLFKPTEAAQIYTALTTLKELLAPSN